MVTQGLPRAFIMEDDVGIYYRPDMMIRLQSAVTELEEKNISWDVLFLSHIPWVAQENTREKVTGSKHWTIPKRCPGLMGYLLKQNAAQLLLEKAFPYQIPVDMFVIDQHNQGRIRALLLNPALSYTVEKTSDTSRIR
jgi:GR25 family glycosyltransferase involved in LPS biosynthesis